MLCMQEALCCSRPFEQRLGVRSGVPKVYDGQRLDGGDAVGVRMHDARTPCSSLAVRFGSKRIESMRK